MFRPFTGRIINVGLALALLLGGMTALMGGQSAAAREPTFGHPGAGGHRFEPGFQARSFEVRPDVVLVPGHWTRASNGYVYAFEVTNRGNLPAHTVLIQVGVDQSQRSFPVQHADRSYAVDIGPLAVGERRRQVVWFGPDDVYGTIRLFHDGFHDGKYVADELRLTIPQVRDHRTS